MSEAAARPKKSATPAARRKPRPALVTAARKREIAGLMLVAVALLVALAIVTYAPDDAPIAQGQPGNPRNAIGSVGAWLAYYAVGGFLGRCSLVFAGLLAAWGYALFRGRSKFGLAIVTVAATAGAFVLAALVGWFALGEGRDVVAWRPWSGDLGATMAGGLSNLLGRPGSFIVLALALAVVALLFVERDIQGVVDRIESALFRVSGWLVRRFEALRNGLVAYRERLAERIEARQDERRARQSPADALSPGPNGRAPGPVSAPTLAASEPVFTFSAPHAAGTPAPATPAFAPFAAPAPPPFAGPAPFSAPTPTAFPSHGVFDAPTALPEAAPPRAPRPAAALIENATDALVVQVREATVEARVDSLGAVDAGEAMDEIPYTPPSIDALDAAPADARPFDPAEIEEHKAVLLEKLETYKIKITAINAIVGPTVTLFELTPAPGIKISRITALEDDLAMAMAARGIRMIAPIPGKSAIGVEIPNRHRQMVRIRDLIATERFKEVKMELPFPIGKGIEGETYVEDLTKMPHVLIAGATGSGKSVGLNTLICGLLYRCHPANLKFVMIDPKKIELTPYARLREHFIAMPENYDEPIVTDYTVALGVLKSCEKEMERRYDLLSKAQVRGIKDYNKRFASGALAPGAGMGTGHRHLPYLVVIVDELADLMMTAGKEIEGPIARLAQMARAVGIHLVLATQRPSVDVITGLIKANFPSRIAYQVASKIDSRTILDQSGAEGLVGNGDLLYMNGSRMVRLQGPYVAMEEVERVTDAIGEQEGPGPYRLPSFEPDEDDDRTMSAVDDQDDLFEEAARIIVRSQQGSVSLLQRKLSIGYGRAARIVDQLEEAGIVGNFEGSKARAVLVQTETQLDGMLGKTPLGFD